jgi:hypothetical protein
VFTTVKERNDLFWLRYEPARPEGMRIRTISLGCEVEDDSGMHLLSYERAEMLSGFGL